ncbi:hypothetical protein KKH42_00655 [bacterium]|nr:hypothetical protein [bacterium]
MNKKKRGFLRDEEAQASVEYILTATLLFVGAYWGYSLFSGILAGLFNRMVKTRTGAVGMGP